MHVYVVVVCDMCECNVCFYLLGMGSDVVAPRSLSFCLPVSAFTHASSFWLIALLAWCCSLLLSYIVVSANI
jgi:hypothetical protein